MNLTYIIKYKSIYATQEVIDNVNLIPIASSLPQFRIEQFYSKILFKTLFFIIELCLDTLNILVILKSTNNTSNS